MTNNADKPSNLPALTVKEGKVVTNSREVARQSKREHHNILKAIDNLARDAGPLKLTDLGFQRVTAFDPSANRVVRSYDMNRDGFTLLAMSFTGKEALAFKLAYIAEFNRMESELRAQAAIGPAQIDVALIAQVVAQATAQALAPVISTLTQAITALVSQPRVEAVIEAPEQPVKPPRKATQPAMAKGAELTRLSRKALANSGPGAIKRKRVLGSLGLPLLCVALRLHCSLASQSCLRAPRPEPQNLL